MALLKIFMSTYCFKLVYEGQVISGMLYDRMGMAHYIESKGKHIYLYDIRRKNGSRVR